MTLTALQQSLRTQTIGASEVPILMGLTPYGDPPTIALIKRGIIEESPWRPNKWMAFGTLAEKSIRVEAEKEIARRYGKIHLPVLSIGGASFSNLETHQGATPDGLYNTDIGVVNLEIKTAGQEWSEPPAKTVYQVQQQLALTFAEVALVVHYQTSEQEVDQFMADAALMDQEYHDGYFKIDPSKITYFEVFPNKELQDQIAVFCTKWWEDHVVQGLPVQPTQKYDDPVIEKKTAVLADDLAERWRKLNDQKDLVELELAELKTLIITSMDKSTKGTTAHGSFSKAWVKAKPSVDASKAWEAAKGLLGDKASALEEAYTKTSAGYYRLTFKENK